MFFQGTEKLPLPLVGVIGKGEDEAMDNPDFVLVVNGVPVCTISGETEPLCSLWAWSQALGIRVTAVPGGYRIGRCRLKTQITRLGGRTFAPVLELAAGMGLNAAVDPRSRRVWVWVVRRKRGYELRRSLAHQYARVPTGRRGRNRFQPPISMDTARYWSRCCPLTRRSDRQRHVGRKTRVVHQRGNPLRCMYRRWKVAWVA